MDGLIVDWGRNTHNDWLLRGPSGWWQTSSFQKGEVKNFIIT